MAAMPSQVLYDNDRGAGYKRHDVPMMNILTNESMPVPLSKRRLQSKELPKFGLMDELVIAHMPPAGGADFHKPCSQVYSHPGFFFEEWLKMEEERQRKAAEERRLLRSGQKQKKKKHRDDKQARKEVESVKTKKFTGAGAEFGGGAAGLVKHEKTAAEAALSAVQRFTVYQAVPITPAIHHTPRNQRDGSTPVPAPQRFFPPTVARPSATPTPTMAASASAAAGPPVSGHARGPSITGPPIGAGGPPVMGGGPPIAASGASGPPLMGAGGPPLMGAGGPPVWVRGVHR